MAFQISRLRRWFAAAAITLILVVAGVYFYARHRVQNALKQVPEKIGVEIQQSARGFTYSQSNQGRTLFKIEASKAVEFKNGGREELHDVEITVYGRDSGRFDRITGKDFEYNAQSGEVVGKGPVQIDLESNPEGLGNPDQSIPKDLKNPVHLTTTDLIFNQKTGDAYSKDGVEFSLPQASGSAIGLNYVAKTSLLTLDSHVLVALGSLSPMMVTANRATLSKDPRLLLLEGPHLREGHYRSEADRATIFLSQDNKLEHALAQGNVVIETDEAEGPKVMAQQAELSIDAKRNALRQATLSGNVRFENPDREGMRGTAGRAVLNFASNSILENVHADGGVALMENPRPSEKSVKSRDFKITAPAIDFSIAQGRVIRRAETSGPPEIAISPADGEQADETTTITAGKFDANFDNKGQLANVHGSPDARIVSKMPGKPDRVSTSQTLIAAFQPGIGITSFTQQENFEYTDGQLAASAGLARYTPANQLLWLTGAPRVIETNMTTTAERIRLNRSTGQAYAAGDVKTTYTSLKPEHGGRLLASSSPVHVTAGAMIAERSPAVARYAGNARLWQDADEVQAPVIEFDKDRRSVGATGSPEERVSTNLVQIDKHGKTTPITISADRLSYLDTEGVVHFEGNVIAVSSDITSTAAKMDCFLQASRQGSHNQRLASPQAVEKIIASGNVVVIQNGRRATGDQVVYTAVDDRFVMTGGPPSIFDAERGKITGVSLTLFGHDGRVLVEGNDKSPAVTETRVAR